MSGCYGRSQHTRAEGRGGELIPTMFDKATLSLGTISVISKVALMAGSSQQGKALRASVAWGGKGETHTVKLLGSASYISTLFNFRLQGQNWTFVKKEKKKCCRMVGSGS